MVGVVRVLQRLVLAVALVLVAGGVAGGVAGLLAAERLQHTQPQHQQQQPRHGAAGEWRLVPVTASHYPQSLTAARGHRSLLPAAAS